MKLKGEPVFTFEVSMTASEVTFLKEELEIGRSLGGRWRALVQAIIDAKEGHNS